MDLYTQGYRNICIIFDIDSHNNSLYGGRSPHIDLYTRGAIIVEVFIDTAIMIILVEGLRPGWICTHNVTEISI